jgi:type III secretion system YscD/HrpQ family protein
MTESPVSTAHMPALQLRVLTGMHAGARCDLDQDTYLIGSGEDCDIVLADAGLMAAHARLERGPGLWRLHWLVDESTDSIPPAPVGLEPGLAVAIGPVIVAVDQSDAPWPTLEQLVLVQSAAGVLEPPAPATEQAASDEVSDGAAGDPVGKASSAAAKSMPASSRRAQRLLAVAGVCAALALLVAVGVVATRTTPRVEAAVVPAPGAVRSAASDASTAVAPPVEHKQAIDKAVQDLGMSKVVTVEPVGSAWRVRGHYLDELAAERLSAALSKLIPKPQARITLLQDLAQDLSDMLSRWGQEKSLAVSAQRLADRRFRLSGRPRTPAERDELLAALGTAFPGVEWDLQLASGEEEAQRLLDELLSAGWEVAGEWQAGVYAMRVRLQPSQVAAWERDLAQAVGRHPVPLKAMVTNDASAVAGVARSPSMSSGRPPFQIRSVVASEPPLVVLDGGHRLLQGGTHMGWRFVGLDTQNLIFDNGNQRATLPR